DPYLPWALAVTIALVGRSKSGYINGKIKAPNPQDPKFEEWEANDNQVMSWLFNSMEPQVCEIFAYSKTSKALWDSLRDMYGHAKNASRVFELQQEISKMEQTAGQSFIDHLGNLKMKWDELKQYRPI
ncbi:UBN2_3 domain-containing protein, partial [Cephalotus follicularis]